MKIMKNGPVTRPETVAAIAFCEDKGWRLSQLNMYRAARVLGPSRLSAVRSAAVPVTRETGTWSA